MKLSSDKQNPKKQYANAAAVLVFDDAAEERFYTWWQQLEALGIARPEFPPHMTLAMYEQLDSACLCGQINTFTANEPQLTLHFTSLGLFAGQSDTLYIAPVVTRQLLELHARLHGACGFPYGNMGALYAPSAWMPHASIAIAGREQIKTATARMLELFEPFEAVAVAIDVYRFYPVEQVERYELVK